MSIKGKISLGITLLAIILTGLYFINKLYLSPDNFLRQIYLVPKDAIYIIETNDPIGNWQKFSKSDPWQYLKAQPKMEEIGTMANTLDSLLRNNTNLFNLLGKRNLMISAHQTRKSTYDFLFLVDLQKSSKIESLKDQMENLFKAGDFRVTSRKFNNEKILELYNPADKTTLYMAFISNHMICSFTGLLIEKSIQEKEDPAIGRDLYFLDVEPKLSNSGLCRIYINYKYLNDYLTMMMGMADDNLRAMCHSLSYTGLDFHANDEMLSLKGYTNLSDATEDSYLPALMHSGSHKLTAHKILSDRTAFFLTMGFDDANRFMDNVENVLKQDDLSYKEFQKNKERIESFLGIDIRKNFLGWMEGEVVFAQNTPGTLGRQNEFVAVIKMKDKKEALTNLDFIEERIRKRTPAKFKTIDYEGFSVHYLEMKGFFRLLFGKMFDDLNKPYYTIIDDYAVFSNSTATLLSMIEDYRLGQTLEKDKIFQRFMDEFNGKSSIFAYTNTIKFFPLMKEFMNAATWKDLQTNQPFVVCFPQTAFQLTGDKNNMFDTRFIAQFAIPPIQEEIPATEEEEPLDFSLREDTLQALELFYIEKMQGNIYTEFYDDGAIKSKSEIKNGIKHGKYLSFCPSGKLQSKGQFKNNKKDGTWEFYNEEGKMIYKEKWKNGAFEKVIEKGNNN